MIPIVWLGDDGISNALGRGDRALCRLNESLLRYRKSESRENAVRFFLVARELHGNVRRAPRDRRLDALLMTAVAELDETLRVQAKPGYVALLRRMYNARGAGTKRTTLC